MKFVNKPCGTESGFDNSDSGVIEHVMDDFDFNFPLDVLGA
jgi:hypothetical protein